MKTNIEERILIAEACGYETPPYDCAVWPKHKWQNHNDGCCYDDVPKYDTLDSIREAVMMQSEEFQNEFECLMECKCGNGFYHQLTALDWLDCFVETVKARKEKK